MRTDTSLLALTIQIKFPNITTIIIITRKAIMTALIRLSPRTICWKFRNLKRKLWKRTTAALNSLMSRTSTEGRHRKYLELIRPLLIIRSRYSVTTSRICRSLAYRKSRKSLQTWKKTKISSKNTLNLWGSMAEASLVNLTHLAYPVLSTLTLRV